MKKVFLILILMTTLALVTCNVYTAVPADMAKEVHWPFDPKKKKVGEECKTSDECQKHHSCASDGEKNVCTEPPKQKLPPGAVT
ncbi:hypothetical protein [Leptospira vanthielii]|uniref:Lipoprotein n=1 Tax=Leptospira vanthielii TaxID=293085 RepID=A0ABY2NLZ2_9LEPT|nr:hypothetical protein [Leptospira vanthielii]TGM52224.1 hypothetical protein EHQ95_11165 [Leptospira vanthielii]